MNDTNQWQKKMIRVKTIVKKSLEDYNDKLIIYNKINELNDKIIKWSNNYKDIAELIEKIGLDKITEDTNTAQQQFKRDYKLMNSMTEGIIEPNYCKICTLNSIDKALSCGHTLCSSCINYIQKDYNNSIKCPFCKQDTDDDKPLKLYIKVMLIAAPYFNDV